MNDYKNLGIIKDVFLVILIVIPFTFIDTRTVLFVGAISTSILLIRRTIHRLNTQHMNGYVITGEGNELAIPKRVEMFELSNSAPMEVLYKYIEVLRAMAIHPSVMIIRFKQIRQINPVEADVLDKVILRLSKHEIKILFSDVDANLKNQLNKYTLVQKVGGNNIFYKVEDALNHAKKIRSVHKKNKNEK